MSRHKKAYDEDDLYDYDDYDDEYDEPDQSYGAGSGGYDDYEQPATSKPKESPSAYVDFVMESLGTIEITPAGTRVTGGISEARVLQMLEGNVRSCVFHLFFISHSLSASTTPSFRHERLISSFL